MDSWSSARCRSARRFTADLLGAALFTTVYTLLGYLGGEVFKQTLWLPLLIALLSAGIVMVGAEVYRRLRLERSDQ